MNTKFLRLFLAALAGMLLMVGAASAQEDSSIMERLGLSAQQKDQIKALREDFQTQTRTLRADIKHLLEQEHDLKSVPSPNESALRAKLKERAEKEIDLSMALTTFYSKLESILTADQKKKLAAYRLEKRNAK